MTAVSRERHGKGSPGNRNKDGRTSMRTQTDRAGIAGSTHPGSAIEWWFVHGSFEGKRSGTRHFMVSFFRYNPDPQGNNGSDGYYLLLSLLDPATRFNSVLSRG